MYRVGVRPSYKTGFAQWSGMAKYPHLWQGLVGAWNMSLGVTGNKLLDFSGNGIHLTAAGTYRWAMGPFGTAMNYESSNLENHRKDQAAVTGYPLTMACWAKSDSNSVNQTMMWLGDKDVDNQMCGIRMDGSAGGDPVGAYSFHTNFDVSTGGGYTVGKWHHVAGVFASQTSRLVYLDGVPGTEDTDDPGTAPSGWDRTAVGALMRSSALAYFDGEIDHALIYNRALSASEIVQLYQLRKRMA